MKIQKQHYAELKCMFAKLDRERVAAGHPGFMKTAAEYRERGLSPKRFRWDWSHRAVGCRYICDVLYADGLNDDHIDSAYRAIARELTDDKNTWSAQ